MIKPLIYGYMRVSDSTPDAEVRQAEQQMSGWAQAEDFNLMAIYAETETGSIEQLSTLIQELNRSGTHTVVVPSFEHFGTSEMLRTYVWQYLVHGAKAEVFEVSEG